MRLIAAACTLVIVAFLAVFGAILLHERTVADPAPVAESASAPASQPQGVATSPVTTLVSAASSAMVPEPQAAAPQAAAPQRPAPQVFAQAPRPAPPAAAPPPAPAA